MEPSWLTWARALQAIAQSGLHFGADRFDLERYEQVRAIAAAMFEAGAGEPAQQLVNLFRQDIGYATPKVDVRGAAFRDDRILLVRERSNGLWALPGGWADVNTTPSNSVEREIHEESGFTARAVRLVAALDRNRHVTQSFPFTVYKLFFLCELTGGAAQPGSETTHVGFFTPDDLPPMSEGRTTPTHIRRMFQHWRNPTLPPDFD